ncbi:MAG: hypothetical protein JRI23_12875, partial [Deltaproteobacteria bacterium]|nr:hypothetical protein [Deltaproteobacteria bacterium]MBW2532611.1 hypothetical protein [Deltaproteobacteria bacterium]
DAYNTATRNCGSELFESLEDALGRRAGFEVRDLDSVDQIQHQSLIFPTLGRHYPKHAEQGLVGLGILPLVPGEQPNEYGRVTDDQIAPDYHAPTLNDQAAAGTLRLD